MTIDKVPGHRIPRWRAILRDYFGCDNAKETARRFGISEARVYQVKAEAMRRLNCHTDYELARRVMRRDRPVTEPSQQLGLRFR